LIKRVLEIKNSLRDIEHGNNPEIFAVAIKQAESALVNYPAYLMELEVKVSIQRFGFDKVLSQFQSVSDLFNRSFSIGLLYLLNGDPSKALENFSVALDIKDGDPLTCFFAARACLDKQLLAESISLFVSPKEQILDESWLYLGRLYNSLNDSNKSEDAFRKSLQEQNDDESFWTLMLYLRDRLRCEKHLESALVDKINILLQRGANELKNAKVELLALKADILAILARFDEAESIYRQALNLDSENASIKANLAPVLLIQKKFQEGYALLEHRDASSVNVLSHQVKTNNLPSWLGESLNNKRLLVLEEQGIGDQILYLRFLQKIVDEYDGVQLSYLTSDRMRLALSDSLTGVNVTSDSDVNDKFDCYCYLADIPRFLNLKTILNPGPYLKSSSSEVNKYQDELHKKFPSKRIIGLSWKSISDTAGSRKNLIFHQLRPLLEASDIQFVCLQYGEISHDLAELNSLAKNKIFVYPNIDLKNDISSLLNLIQALDSVVTVSNAVAHMSGALGQNTFVLLPKAPIWHWFLDDRESPWYASVHLYRQTSFNDWSDAVYGLKNDLIGSFEPKPLNKSEEQQSDLVDYSFNQGDLESAYSSKDYEAVVSKLRSFEVSSLTSENAYMLAVSYLKIGQFDISRSIADKMFKLHPDNENWLLLFAKLGNAQGMSDHALTILRSIDDPSCEMVLEEIETGLLLDHSIEDLKINLSQLIRSAKKDNELNNISEYLSYLRDWLNRHQFLSQKRLDLLKSGVQEFDRYHGKRNEVVRYSLMGDIANLEGDREKAISLFRQGAKIRPDLKDKFVMNEAYSLLSLGDFRSGFKLIKKRFELDKRIRVDSSDIYTSIPYLSTSSPVRECNLLINSEQGLGDQVLMLQTLIKVCNKFPRYQITVRLPNRLVNMVNRSIPQLKLVVDELEPLTQELIESFDYQIELGDIPLLVIEEYDHYLPEVSFLKPKSALVEHFKCTYEEKFPGKKLVGISWRSASASWGGRKDLNLEDFLPLLDTEDVQFVSIQYADVEAELTAFNEKYQQSIYLDDSFDATNDLEHVMAQIAALDHVVTVSNVNAHFAGAIGVPTDVIVKKLALWHWQTDTDKCLWYPSVKIWRETQYNVFEPIMKDIKDALVTEPSEVSDKTG
jgi:tetratricopeptide (TPR) repeat protein